MKAASLAAYATAVLVLADLAGAGAYHYHRNDAPATAVTLIATTDCEGVSSDGVTPSAAGLEACINGCIQSLKCTEVLLRGGEYLLERSLHLNPTGGPHPLTLRGEGKATALLWPADEDLLVFGSSTELTLAAMSLVSTGPKSPNSTAIRFTAALTRSLFDALLIVGDNPAHNPGSGLNLGTLTDSCTVREVQIWGVTGTGITIGTGSQVIIKGGRVIGNGPVPRGTSIGVHCTGNNGGVHVAQTDVIGHLEAVRLDNSSGAGSNREIFLAQATVRPQATTVAFALRLCVDSLLAVGCSSTRPGEA